LAGLVKADETEDRDKVEEKRRLRVLPAATDDEMTFDFSTAAANVSSTAMRLATASS